VEQAATGAAELRKRVSGDRKRIVPPENHDRRPDHGQRQRARVGPLPKFDQILRKFARLVYMVQVGSQKYRSMVFFFFLLSYLACSQIWVNWLMDDLKHLQLHHKVGKNNNQKKKSRLLPKRVLIIFFYPLK